MEVRTNKIGDIRKYYFQKLKDLFNEKEANALIFELIKEYAGLNKSVVLSDPEKTLSESELLKIHFGVKQLLNKKPIQYITGKVDFFGLNLKVTPDVLIPRPETEEMVGMMLKEIPEDRSLKILDIGTGSGCIAITLKKKLPNSEIIAIDISEPALEVARVNAESNHVNIDFHKIDILNLTQRSSLPDFDWVVSNPPYVSLIEKKQMDKNVLEFEPSIALFPTGDDPLIFYRAIATFCLDHLKPKSIFLCEVNQYLGIQTKNIFDDLGFFDLKLKKDLSGNTRFLCGRRK
jgi:release factor glutamine methyltransferase